jgi:pilus assembly protein CpaE
MYPLKVILVGCNGNTLPQVRQALHENPAVTEAEFSQAAEAIDNYRWAQDEGRLLVVHIRSLQEVEDVQRLKRTFPAWPILALIDAPRGQAFELALLANRAGASQVVPAPLDAEDFRAALDAIGKDHGYAAANAKVLAVSGVTGGCGATALAINLAHELLHLEKTRAIVAELNFQRGMLATYLNVEPSYVVHDLLASEGKLDLHMVQKALTPVTDNFLLLSGAHHAITPLEVQPRDLQRLLDYLRRLAQVLVLDVPCTSDDLYVQTLAAADQVILVAEPTLASLRALRLVLDLLGRGETSQATGIATVHLVLNRYDPRNEEFDLKKVENLLKVPRLNTVANDYAAMSAALNSGQPLRQKAPRSRALADIDRLARLLWTGIEPQTAGGWKLLGKLSRVFG